MAVSEVAIYNMALDMLDEGPVTDPSEDSRAARLLNRNYAQTRDEVLRAHPWNFALTRAALPVLADAPAFGWLRAYQLPGDCLRILPLKRDGSLNGRPIPHEIEARQILTDLPAPLPIRYIRRVTDTGQFDPLFCRALAARLAVYVGHVITGKQSYVERMGRLYADVLTDARKVDALEGAPPDPLGEDWIEARY